MCLQVDGLFTDFFFSFPTLAKSLPKKSLFTIRKAAPTSVIEPTLPTQRGEILRTLKITFEDVSQSNSNLKTESPSQFNQLHGQFRHGGITPP